MPHRISPAISALTAALVVAALAAGTLPVRAAPPGSEESCLAKVKPRAGGSARVVKVSGTDVGVVRLAASGGRYFTCFTDSTGQAVAIHQDKKQD